MTDKERAQYEAEEAAKAEKTLEALESWLRIIIAQEVVAVTRSANDSRVFDAVSNSKAKAARKLLAIKLTER